VHGHGGRGPGRQLDDIIFNPILFQKKLLVFPLYQVFFFFFFFLNSISFFKNKVIRFKNKKEVDLGYLA